MLAASSIHALFLFAKRILILSWEMYCLGGPGLHPRDLVRGSCSSRLLTATQGWGNVCSPGLHRELWGMPAGGPEECSVSFQKSPLLPPGAVMSEVMSRAMAAT